MAISDWFDFDLPEMDMQVLAITFGFWAFCMLIFWKFVPNMSLVPLSARIITTILSFPVIYFMVKYQLSK